MLDTAGLAQSSAFSLMDSTELYFCFFVVNADPHEMFCENPVVKITSFHPSGS